MNRFLSTFIFIASLFLVAGCGSEKKITDPPDDQGTGTGNPTGTGTSTGGNTGGNCDATCGSKQCGPDGCGGFCGICQPGTACDPTGMCSAVSCKPKCEHKACGPDTCGGFCGVCPTGQSCNGAGACTDGNGGCVPKCDDKECGDDGCGNLCGKCGPGKVCDEGKGQCILTDNQCGTITEVGECQQSDTVAVTCKAGKLISIICNPDKGLVCGYNETKNKHDCIKAGCQPQCTDKACGGDGCGGICGQCKPSETCNADGKCVQGNECVPNCSGKECGPNGCGGQCGICGGGDTCTQGQCIDPNNCDASCSGKECGPDGCGGTCGTCLPSQSCVAGACKASVCTPSCVGKDCGNDGCGGSCGTCPDTQSCDVAGHCVTAGDGACGDLTYEGKCDTDGTTVLWCEGGAVKSQDCKAYGADYKCSWITSQETYWCTNSCQSACDNKECGDDACGGSCGTCSGDKVCNSGICSAPGGGGECGDISYEGICEGNTLKYCSLDTLQVVNCGALGKNCGWNSDFNFNACKTPAEGECVPNCLLGENDNKECGDDGCGNLCGICAGGESCNAGKCGTGGGGDDDCGDIDITGVCEGTVLKFCTGSSLFTKDCGETGKVCGFDAEMEWFDCLEGSGSGGEAGGPCGAITEKGVCLENTQTVNYCKDAVLQTLKCTDFDTFCMWNPDDNGGSGGYDCLDDPGCEGTCPANKRCQADGTCGCDNISPDGHCEGNMLVYCQTVAQTLVTENCGSGPTPGVCVVVSGFADCASDI